MKCQNCATENNADEIFCVVCGVKLVKEEVIEVIEDNIKNKNKLCNKFFKKVKDKVNMNQNDSSKTKSNLSFFMKSLRNIAIAVFSLIAIVLLIILYIEMFGSEPEDFIYTKLSDTTARIEYYNGDVYEGEVQENAANGVGTLYFLNGDTYTGQFQDGYFEGIGTYYNAIGGYWLYGEGWSKSILNGIGEVAYEKDAYIMIKDDTRFLQQGQIIYIYYENSIPAYFVD